MDVVEGLPEIERAVVECIIWGGMSKVEAAKTLNVSRSYVHKVYRRAKERLACLLADS
jgi:DNA-directed RNA polymerase specialized sigma24 family protein